MRPSPPTAHAQNKQGTSLREFIDVKAALYQDGARLGEDERETQDRDIAQQIRPAKLAPPALYLRWLEKREMRGGAAEESPGRVVEKAYEIAAFVLTALGFLSGWLLVWGWLTHDQSQPTNVIHFVAVVAAVPFLLFLSWCIAALPRRVLAWLPGAGMMVHVTALWQWVWRMSQRALNRFSRERNAAMAPVWQSLKTNQRVLFWLVARLPQMTGAAFALGAALALVAAFYLTDPALGWRSRLMNGAQLARVTRAVASPWTLLAPGAMVPNAQQIRATRYSSLGLRFAAAARATRGERQAWSAWWSFALMSILVYGLLPRLIGIGLTRWQYRRALKRCWRRDGELQALRARLQNPLAIRSAPMEAPPASRDVAEMPATAGRRPTPGEGQPCHVLQWSGVELDDGTIRAWLGRQFDVNIGDVRPVGGRVRDDQEALANLHSQAERVQYVLLLVHSRDEPVIDHREFCRELREAVGEEGALTIVLCAFHKGEPTPLEQECERQWRRVAPAFGAHVVVAPVGDDTA